MRALLTLLLCLSPTLWATELPLLPMGKLPVACSDVSQDYSKVPLGETAQSVWEGNNGHYVTTLLKANAGMVFEHSIPNKPLFKRYAGVRLPVAMIVCYPTAADNPRAPYVLPTGIAVPKMQRDGQAPIYADVSTKYPLMVFSHGLGGSPLNDDYLLFAQELAARGYIVALPFHADKRYSKIKIEGLSDALAILLGFPEVVETMALRPVALSAMLDKLLADPNFAPRIDQSAIVGFGTSLGGQSLMLQAGAKLTTSLSGDGAPTEVIADNRLAAIVGYVPYSGTFISDAFGKNNVGVANLRIPYLGIGGNFDTVAPLTNTREMVKQLAGSKYLVEIQGLDHTFIAWQAPEIISWMDYFYAAHLGDNLSKRANFAQATSIKGPTDDRITQSRTLPWAYQDEVDVVEYYHAGLKHYFMTGHKDEQLWLDRTASLGWSRTGESFLMFKSASAALLAGLTPAPVCRFYAGTEGRNTHFYTASDAECQLVKRDKGWAYEGLVAYAGVNPACPTTTLKRAQNNRFMQNDGNHRFYTKASIETQMRNLGWGIEGNVMCIGN